MAACFTISATSNRFVNPCIWDGTLLRGLLEWGVRIRPLACTYQDISVLMLIDLSIVGGVMSAVYIMNSWTVVSSQTVTHPCGAAVCTSFFSSSNAAFGCKHCSSEEFRFCSPCCWASCVHLDQLTLFVIGNKGGLPLVGAWVMVVSGLSHCVLRHEITSHRVSPLDYRHDVAKYMAIAQHLPRLRAYQAESHCKYNVPVMVPSSFKMGISVLV